MVRNLFTGWGSEFRGESPLPLRERLKLLDHYIHMYMPQYRTPIYFPNFNALYTLKLKWSEVHVQKKKKSVAVVHVHFI